MVKLFCSDANLCLEQSNERDPKRPSHFHTRSVRYATFFPSFGGKKRFIDFFNDLNNSVLDSAVDVEWWDLDLSNKKLQSTSVAANVLANP
jgi:hypothetical protein